MNVEVVDNTMQDLDPFSPAPKALQLSPQPLTVRKVADFRDSSQVVVDSISHNKDSDPTKQELNVDLYEGLLDKVVNEVAIQLDPMLQQMSSAERRDLANLGLWKEKK